MLCSLENGDPKLRGLDELGRRADDPARILDEQSATPLSRLKSVPVDDIQLAILKRRPFELPKSCFVLRDEQVAFKVVGLHRTLQQTDFDVEFYDSGIVKTGQTVMRDDELWSILERSEKAKLEHVS